MGGAAISIGAESTTSSGIPPDSPVGTQRSDRELAEDRARDVPENRHHVAERRRHPHRLLAAGQSVDDRARRPRRVSSTAARPPCPRSSSCARSRGGRPSRRTPLPDEAVAEPLEEGVHPGLRRAVDEVRAPGPLARDRRERDDRAVALLAHALRERHRDRHHAHVVGDARCRRRRRGPARPPPGRRARRTRGARGRRRRSGRTRRRRTRRASRCRARRTAPPRRSSRRARGAPATVSASEPGSRAASTTVRARSATSRRSVARAMSEPPPSTRTDWTAPRASRIRGARGGAGGRTGARAIGSTRSRSSAEAVEVGVHELEQLGAQAGVLGEVDAPTGFDDELVEVVEERGEARARRRDVERQRPSRRAGTTAGRGSPRRSA